jgi:hypothetical protein
MKRIAISATIAASLVLAACGGRVVVVHTVTAPVPEDTTEVSASGADRAAEQERQPRPAAEDVTQQETGRQALGAVRVSKEPGGVHAPDDTERSRSGATDFLAWVTSV